MLGTYCKGRFTHSDIKIMNKIFTVKLRSDVRNKLILLKKFLKVQSRIQCLSSQGQNMSLSSEMLCHSLVYLITKVNYNLSFL